MKTELGITKGEFEVSPNNVEVGDSLFVKVENHGSAICQIYTNNKSVKSIEQAVCNAELIAETFNVANETGKTPRQLAEENKALLEALISISEYWNRDRNDGAMHDALWHIINVSESAIKQSTE